MAFLKSYKGGINVLLLHAQLFHSPNPSLINNDSWESVVYVDTPEFRIK